MNKELFDGKRRCFLSFLYSPVDGRCGIILDLFFEGFIPQTFVFKVCLESLDRVPFLPLFHFFLRPVFGGVIRGRVAGHPVRVGLDECCSLTGFGFIDGFLGGGIHGENVVSVNQNAWETVGKGFLGQCLGGCLFGSGHRNRVLIVETDKHIGCSVDAGEIEGLVEISLGSGPVAERTQNTDLFLFHFGGHTRSDRMGELGGHRNGQGENIQSRRDMHSFLVPHPVQIIVFQRKPQSDVHSEISEIREEPIFFLEGKG